MALKFFSSKSHMSIYDIYTMHTKLINYVLYKIYTKYKFKHLQLQETSDFKQLLHSLIHKSYVPFLINAIINSTTFFTVLQLNMFFLFLILHSDFL